MSEEYKENEILNKINLSLDYADRFELEDSEGRRIYINADIDDGVIDTAVYHILRYNRLDKEHNIPIGERRPILIYENSVGGSIIACFSLIDTILISDTPIYTVNIGVCFSAALLVYMAGHKRYSMQHSQFLLHEGQISGADRKDRISFH